MCGAYPSHKGATSTMAAGQCVHMVRTSGAAGGWLGNIDSPIPLAQRRPHFTHPHRPAPPRAALPLPPAGRCGSNGAPTRRPGPWTRQSRRCARWEVAPSRVWSRCQLAPTSRLARPASRTGSWSCWRTRRVRRAAGGGSRDEDPVCAAGRGRSGALLLPGLPTTSPIPVAPPTPFRLPCSAPRVLRSPAAPGGGEGAHPAAEGGHPRTGLYCVRGEGPGTLLDRLVLEQAESTTIAALQADAARAHAIRGQLAIFSHRAACRHVSA